MTDRPDPRPPRRTGRLLARRRLPPTRPSLRARRESAPFADEQADEEHAWARQRGPPAATLAGTAFDDAIPSWSNTLSSVRQATQRNAGRKTAGVDGEVALTPQAKAELAVHVHREARSWRPRPIKRVYIPKAGNRAKLRPLGIPVIADRCHQSASRRRAA